MTRKLVEKRLVVASHNWHKLHEIEDLLRPYDVEPVPAGELDLPEPEETETTFVGNALLKARAAAATTGMPALGDDSGLAVTALNGDPGIYSARWGGPERDFSLGARRVREAMTASGSDDVTARFICVIALCWPDGEEMVFEGEAPGTIIWPPRGKRGFGYDSIFLPDGGSLTFGEMDQDEKHAISHRAAAFRRLLETCLK